MYVKDSIPPALFIPDSGDDGFNSMTTSTDPAGTPTFAAVTTSNVNLYAGVIVTLTGAGNAQTIQNPTDTTPGKVFTVVNNDTSTHSIVVNGFTITPGETQSFIWDGSAWGPVDLGITELPVLVTQGGTGLATVTDGAIMLGSGTGAVTPLADVATGQVLVSGGVGADPAYSATPSLTSITVATAKITTGAALGSLVKSDADGDLSYLADVATGQVLASGGVGVDPAYTANPTVASATLTTAIADNTATTQAATTAFAKSEAAVLAREPNQGVAMTAAASGSSGITVADNDNIDFGTGNFTLVWKGSLPDWTPSANQILLAKRQDDDNRYQLYLSSDAKLIYLHAKTGGTSVSKETTSAISLTNNTAHEITAVVTRETASAAGSVSFHIDGVLLETVAITAGIPADLSNTGTLAVLGYSTTRYAGTTHHAITFNRALTAAEVLDLYRNGIAESDKWGSQTAVYTSDFSAGVDSWTGAQGTATGNVDTIGGQDNNLSFYASSANDTHYLNKTGVFAYGKRYRVLFSYYIPSANTNIDGILFNTPGQSTASGTALIAGTTEDVWTTVSVEFTNAIQATSIAIVGTKAGVRTFVGANSAVDDLFYLRAITITEIGATLALEPEGIQPNKWIDATTNQLDASYPTTGYSFTRPFPKELALVDSDIAHGMTTLASTDTFGKLSAISGTVGGLDVVGLTDATQDGALRLTGVIGAADPTDTHAAVHLRGGKVDGTGWTDLAAAETVLRLSNHEADLITVLGNGNVGIGTTGPGAKLDVSGNIRTSGTLLYDSGALGIYDSGGNTVDFSGGDAYPSAYIFKTTGLTTGAMYINSNGNVGIGTTNPGAKLDVASGYYNPAAGPNALTLGADILALTRTDNTRKIAVVNAIPYATASKPIGVLWIDNDAAYTNFYIGGGNGYSNAVTHIGFWTAADTTTAGGTERLTILNDGNVGIGTTDLDGTPAVGQLTVKGTTTDGSTLIFVGRDSAEANVITVDTDGDILNSAGVYGTISDEKLKGGIKDATAKLSDLLKVKVRHFNLKSKPDLKQLGVVAQELETVFPGMVTSTPDMERVLDLDWVPKTQKRQKTETKTVESPKTEILEIDGRHVRKTIIEMVDETVPIFDEVPLYSESGEMLMQMVSPAKEAVLDEEGNEIESAVEAVYAPVMHRIPRMEEYTETEDQRPMIVQPTGTVTKSVKTSVFIPMLIKAVQELAARVEDLEKRR
jgi:hypothetical protein